MSSLVGSVVCRGCGQSVACVGPAFTHGWCRACWSRRRSQLAASGALRVAQLRPPREGSKPLNGQLAFASFTEALHECHGPSCPIQRKGGA